MYFLFEWLEQDGIKNILSLVDKLLNIIRFVVPIGLILMTTWDIFHKVLDPNDKEFQKKIMYRVIAAVIVFFIPTIVNIVMNVINNTLGDDKKDYQKNNGNSGEISKTTPTNKTTLSITERPITTSKLSISNCPSRTYRKGDKLTLISNINSNNYWSSSNSQIIKITSGISNKNVDVEIVNDSLDGYAYINLDNNGQKDTCKINIERPQVTGDIKIINCPTNDKIYKKGDTFTLNIEGLNNYDGDYTWNVSPQDKFSANIKNNGKSVEIKVLDYYGVGFNFFAVSAYGKTDSCKVNIHPSENLSGDIKINNCPYEKIKVGDSFTVSASGEIDRWYGEIYYKYYDLIDNQNGTVTIKIKEHFSDNLRLRVTAYDKNGKSGSCSFYTYEDK